MSSINWMGERDTTPPSGKIVARKDSANPSSPTARRILPSGNNNDAATTPAQPMVLAKWLCALGADWSRWRATSAKWLMTRER